MGLLSRNLGYVSYLLGKIENSKINLDNLLGKVDNVLGNIGNAFGKMEFLLEKI